MKTYVCDCCNTIISDPYEVKMKEFYLRTKFDFGGAYPVETTDRRKIHLCGNCFNNLKNIANKKGGAEE